MTKNDKIARSAELALSTHQTLKKLTDCLNKESEAVSKNDAKTMDALHAEKIMLMEQYKSLCERLEKEKDTLSFMDDDVKKSLEKTKTEFQAAIIKNKNTLDAAHSAVTRIMNRILTTARRVVLQDQKGYDAKGSLVNDPASLMIPTKLNETT